MNKNIAIVVTTISKPNSVLLELARQSYSNKYYFVIIGDLDSPNDLNNIEGSDYFSIERQEKTGLNIRFDNIVYEYGIDRVCCLRPRKLHMGVAICGLKTALPGFSIIN